MQPNFRLCAKEYFDDYTHLTPLSDRSLGDLLTVAGFRVVHAEPRFLPLTLKGRGGNLTFLMPWYLRSPWRPLAGQMLFVVADGMGGHAAGDVASRLTVEIFKGVDLGQPSVEDIRRAAGGANDAVVGHAIAHPESQGMGCTLAGACVVESGGLPHWAVFNLGDSRVYALAEGRLQQLTTDHSEVQELVAAGRITHAEARTHPMRHVITRAVGEIPPALLDLVLVPALSGQRLLVTTDGLTSEIDDDEIAAVLRETTEPQVAAGLLIDKALRAGGHDNITVVVVDVIEIDGSATGRASTTVPRGLIKRETVS
jgi:protein phosphatase